MEAAGDIRDSGARKKCGWYRFARRREEDESLIGTAGKSASRQRLRCITCMASMPLTKQTASEPKTPLMGRDYEEMLNGQQTAKEATPTASLPLRHDARRCPAEGTDDATASTTGQAANTLQGEGQAAEGEGGVACGRRA